MPRIIHFEVHATDPDKVITFYKRVFDWQFNPLPGGQYWLISTGDEKSPGINGGLMKRMGGPPIEGQPVNAFVCTLDVPNVDEFVKKALAAGATMALPKMAIANVGWQAYVKDPDGNIIGLHQADPSAR
jgi:predicted enzyme related to lactoylglutathione lyase